jgi:hypothetical protein
MRQIALLLGIFVATGCTLFNTTVLAPRQIGVDCATAAVVGLRWSSPANSARPAGYRVQRNGRLIATTSESNFIDGSVSGSSTYTYVVSAFDAAGQEFAADPLPVSTPAASLQGDAPYCPSPLIRDMAWDWSHADRTADGSDLWPVTWGQDGKVYAFFGDGGGFGGDDYRGRTSFGIAMISRPPPLSPDAEVNVYGGYQGRHASDLSGKARALVALGADFYAIAGIYRNGDPKFLGPQPIAGAPEHVEIVYSRGNAHTWQVAKWNFCAAGGFCPSGFVQFGPGNAGSPGHYVYLLGTSEAADLRAAADVPAARTYLARVSKRNILAPAAYQYFGGLDSHSRPIWSIDAAHMQPIFTDHNDKQPGCGGQCIMSGTLEEAVYNSAMKRFIGVAQGDYLAQTSFYESAHPWGPWATISYNNIDAASGAGGWGNLGIGAGESLGVHPVNAWTGVDGKSMWMTYSSDGVSPVGALFPPAGAKLDALHLVRVDLQLAGPKARSP